METQNSQVQVKEEPTNGDVKLQFKSKRKSMFDIRPEGMLYRVCTIFSSSNTTGDSF